MVGFADTLFGGSRFIRWALVPPVVLTMITLAHAELVAPQRPLVSLVVQVPLALLFVALVAPSRGRWAARALGGIVFVAYCVYFVHRVVTHPGSLRWPSSRAESSAGNALMGLIVIGVPALSLALFGGRRDAAPEPEEGVGGRFVDDQHSTPRPPHRAPDDRAHA